MKKIIFFTLVIICFVCCNFLFAQNSPGTISSATRITAGIQSPLRIAIDKSDRIYVTDPFIKSLKQYDNLGNLNADFTLWFSPVSVAVNSENRVFVGNSNDGKVYQLNNDGSTSVFYSGTKFPSSMVFGADKNLYITDSKLNTVLVVDPAGVLVRQIGEGMFAFPTGIAYDHKNGRILVAEHGGVSNNSQMKVFIFSLSGSLINSFGAYGSDNGQFYRNQGLTVGRCGYIYIPEPVQGYVNVFSEDGVFITRFGQYGDNPGELKVPMDIVFDSQDRVIATSMNNGALEVFNITDSLPSSNLSNTDISVCEGGTANVPVMLTGTAPWSFTYTIDGLNPHTVTNTYTNPHVLTFAQSGVLKITALSDAKYPGTCFTESAIVTVHPLSTASIDTDTISISTGQSASIPVTFTGTGPWNFTYTKDGISVPMLNISANPYTLLVAQPGIYEITAISDAHCTGTNFSGITTVVSNIFPTASIISGDTLIQTGTSANISVAFTGTAPWNFTYTVNGANPVTITNVSSSPYVFSVNQAGTYQITALSDAINSGLFFSGSATINIQPLPTANITSGNASICYGATTDIAISFTGSAPYGFTYTIDNLNPVSVTNITANPYPLNISEAGVYNIVALHDAYFAGTSFTGSAAITVNPLPVSNITSGNDFMCAGNTSPVTIELTGNVPWSITYSINGANPTTINNITSTSFTFDASLAGLYEIQSVSDANCIGNSFGNAYITVLPKPTSNLLSGNVSYCYGEYAIIPVQFSGNAPWTFTFTQDGVSPLTITNITENPYDLYVIETGNYQLTVLSDAQCSGTDLTGSTNVMLNTVPTATILTTAKTICQGTMTDIAFNFTGSAPWNFTYTVNGGNPVTVNNISTPDYSLYVSEPGTYEIIALSDAICSGNQFSGTAVISYYEMPATNISTAKPHICPGTPTAISISFSGNAPWDFSYEMPGAGFVNIAGNTSNPYIINASIPGTYEVIAVNDAYCTGTSLFGSVTLTESLLPSANLLVSASSICPGASTDISVEFSGTSPWAFTYSKDGINHVSVNDITSSPYTFPVNEAGQYAVTSFSDANCIINNAGNVVTLAAAIPPTSNITESNEVICPGTSASLDISFTGTAPWDFTYTCNGAYPVQLNNIMQNTLTIPVTNEGIYQVLAVSDANCTGQSFSGLKSVEYNVPSSNIVSGNVLICTGTSADLVVELLGKAPWSFTYAKDGQIISTVNNVTSSTYFLPVTDEGTYVISALEDSMCAGVYMYGSSTLSFKPMPAATITDNNISVCEGAIADISIDLVGTAPWSLTYTKDGVNPVTIADIYTSNYILPVTLQGDYAISALNDANCASNNIAATATVNINPLPIVDLGTDIVTCLNNPVTINAGNGFAVYQWSNGTTNQDLSVNTSGTYSVQVTDNNGCSNTDEINVSLNSLPVVNLGTDIAFCQGQSTTLDAGAGFAAYVWNDASTNQINSVATAGTYSVQVTDNNGCSTIDEINVTVNALPVVNLGTDIAFCQGQSTTLDAGAGFAAYVWNDASTNQTNSVATAGTYSVQVTDNNGCSNTDEIIVSVSLMPEPSFSYTANSLDVIFTNSSQNANSYFWNFGDGLTSTELNPAHSYAASGTYIVSLTASAPPCSDSIVSQSIQIIEVGLDNLSLENTVKIYPNPTNGKVTFSVANNPSGVMQIIIYNTIGQEIYTKQINGLNATEEIDLSHHAAGIYNVKIVSMHLIRTVKLILN